jgi:hypothetical protein
MVTHYEQRCHMVSKPHMRTETTYTSQYDAFSHSTRSVPQTRMVTDYQMENECRSEPVTQMETHWEFAQEWHYTAPHTEFLTQKRLKETEPVCEVVEDPQGTGHVEGVAYSAADGEDFVTDREQPAEAPEITDPGASLCGKAYKKLAELADAWVEWNPGRSAKTLPGHTEFLSVCNELQDTQQRCLTLPYARANHDACVKRIDALKPDLRRRLDGLFLQPE